MVRDAETEGIQLVLGEDLYLLSCVSVILGLSGFISTLFTICCWGRGSFWLMAID